MAGGGKYEAKWGDESEADEESQSKGQALEGDLHVPSFSL